jgi:hypothetical protein
MSDLWVPEAPPEDEVRELTEADLADAPQEIRDLVAALTGDPEAVKRTEARILEGMHRQIQHLQMQSVFWSIADSLVFDAPPMVGIAHGGDPRDN